MKDLIDIINDLEKAVSYLNKFDELGVEPARWLASTKTGDAIKELRNTRVAIQEYHDYVDTYPDNHYDSDSYPETFKSYIQNEWEGVY